MSSLAFMLICESISISTGSKDSEMHKSSAGTNDEWSMLILRLRYGDLSVGAWAIGKSSINSGPIFRWRRSRIEIHIGENLRVLDTNDICDSLRHDKRSIEE